MKDKPDVRSIVSNQPDNSRQRLITDLKYVSCLQPDNTCHSALKVNVSEKYVSDLKLQS